MANAGNSISIKQWIAQWQDVPHMFQLNVWNFEVLVGTSGSHIFKQSFALGRFNSQGAPAWKKTGKLNRQYKPVGGLIEEGDLLDSIRYKIEHKSGKSSKVKIYTEKNAFSSHHHTKYGDFFCYAAIHNEPQSSPLKTGLAKRIVQRQFMPRDKDSTVMEDKLTSLGRVLFLGFPGGGGPKGYSSKLAPTKYHFGKIKQ